MADAAGLVDKIKKAALEAQESTKPVNVLFGEVQSVNPLIINVEQKMKLGEGQLILSRNVTDYMTTVTVQWETDEHRIRHKHKEDSGADTEYTEIPHCHGIEGQKNFLIHNALEVGEEVILVRQQGGQQYIVIDRIGGR